MLRRVSCFTLLVTSVLLGSGELSNRRAPGFALPDPEYKHYYDLQDYRGKVVLLDIMNTGCPHCLLLSTTLEQMKAKYGDKIAVLEIVLPPDNQGTIAKYKSMNKVTATVLCDMGQMTQSYFNATPTNSHIDVPHLFVIDKQGMIRNDFTYDAKSRDIFEGPGLFAEIDKLLK